MSRRARNFEHFKGSSVDATTQNILRHNSRTVKGVTMREQLVKTQLGNDTWQLRPTEIEATSQMSPAKAQRIAATLHRTAK